MSRTLLIILILLLSGLFGFVLGQVHIFGNLSGTLIDTSYIVDGNIIVQAGDSLTIEPGAEFQFSGSYYFNISGYLQAIGTEADSIVFKHTTGPGYWAGINFLADCSDLSRLEYCDVSTSNGNGVEITGASPTISHCDLSYNNSRGLAIAGGSVSIILYCSINSNNGGGILVNNSTAIANNCTIKSNNSSPSGGGILCTNNAVSEFIDCVIDSNSCSASYPYSGGGGGICNNGASDITLISCLISNNNSYINTNCGGVLNYENNSYIYMDSCIITRNRSSGAGGGLYAYWYGSGEIYNCAFEFNQGTQGGAIYGGNNSSYVFERCTFLSNTASSYGGAICGSTNFNYCNFSRNYSTLEGGAIRTFISYSNINHCLVNDNNSNQGGGIWGYASIINSTIVNNNATLAGGIYGHCSEFVNNIVAFNIGSGIHQCSNYPLEYSDFYGNTGGNFSGIIPAGLGNIVSVNANGDSCDIFHNIYQDPLFVNQPGEDYHLSAESPCINAGDPMSFPDPDGTISDMGALYYDLSIPVAVEGFCLLENQLIHTNSKIIFFNLFFPEETDSAYTDQIGFYGINLTSGVYDIHFTHSNYITEFIFQTPFDANTTLPTIELEFGIALYGNISGIVEVGDYLVIQPIYIEYGDSLIINPGTRLSFLDSTEFRISGTLIAQGTIVDSIVFTAEDTVLGWSGFRFYDTDTNRISLFSYCVFEYGYADGPNDSLGGAILSDETRITINNSSFRSNSAYKGGAIYALSNTEIYLGSCNILNNFAILEGGGIMVFDSYINLSNSLVYQNEADNGSGGGIFITSFSSADINNSTISQNYSGASGGGIICYASSVMDLINSSIIDNQAYNNGGGICMNSNSHAYIDNCLIAENTTNSEGAGTYGPVTLTNSEISDNSASMGAGGSEIGSGSSISHCIYQHNLSTYNGGAIQLEDNPIIDHCVFFENISYNYGSVVHCLYADEVQLTNSIFLNNDTDWGSYYNNTGEESVVEYNCFPGLINNFFGNCPLGIGQITIVNTNGDSCDIYNNIFREPLFSFYTGSSAFHLSELSPCIDAGDPDSPLDPDSTISDMGAFYFDQRPPITNLVISFAGEDVILHWEAVVGASLYHIYRSDSPYFEIPGMNPIATVTEPTFIDAEIVPNNRYFYRVTWE